MSYRVDKQGLFNRLAGWDGFLKRKVHLIACGGTALTLIGVKPSTKDMDFLVPVIDEHDYLVGILKQMGYKSASGWGWEKGDGYIFDLFRGKSVHTTELLESPLENQNHTLIREFSRIYLGMLNHYDLIISKLFRATTVDIDDCLQLIKAKNAEIDFSRLEARFKETASYDVSERNVLKNFAHFKGILKKEGFWDGK